MDMKLERALMELYKVDRTLYRHGQVTKLIPKSGSSCKAKSDLPAVRGATAAPKIWIELLWRPEDQLATRQTMMINYGSACTLRVH